MKHRGKNLNLGLHGKVWQNCVPGTEPLRGLRKAQGLQVRLRKGGSQEHPWRGPRGILEKLTLPRAAESGQCGLKNLQDPTLTEHKMPFPQGFTERGV